MRNESSSTGWTYIGLGLGLLAFVLLSLLFFAVYSLPMPYKGPLEFLYIFLIFLVVLGFVLIWLGIRERKQAQLMQTLARRRTTGKKASNNSDQVR